MPHEAVPQPHRFVAPAHWRAIDFISDLHLSAQMPKTFVAWRDHLLGTTADAVFLLGDWFELWVGDDVRARPFEQRCVEVMQQASQRLVLGVMVGNRDFLLGAEMLRACGAQGLPDPTSIDAFGARLLASHGDALCLADVDYQQFRALVRGPEWQREFLAKPLAERQQIATNIRAQSAARQRFEGAMWADVDNAETLRWLRAADCEHLVHGHTHRPAHHDVDDRHTREVLSDWDLDGAHRAEVLRWTSDGLRRMAPAHASSA